MHSILFSGLVRHASPTPECGLPLHFLAEFKHRIFSFDAVMVQMGESRSIHEHDDEAAHLQCTLCVHHVGLGSSRANIWLDRDPLSCEFLCTPMCFLLWLRRNRIHRRDVMARKHRTVVVKLLWPTNRNVE